MPNAFWWFSQTTPVGILVDSNGRPIWAAYCCCGSGSGTGTGSGSGSGTGTGSGSGPSGPIQTDCCDNAIARTLSITIDSAVSGCAGLNGTYELEYLDAAGVWQVAIAHGGGFVRIEIYCNGSVWNHDVFGLSGCTLSGTNGLLTSCDPFEYIGNFSTGDGGCDICGSLGSANFTVTE